MSKSETSTSQRKILNFEQALLQWFNQVTKLNTQVNSQAVMEKAKHFSVEFDLNFKPNTAWLIRWKKRQNLNMDMIVFSHPAVRSRLEQLMGSNVVRITDRRYMQTLQQRIREDHMQCLEKRIKEREKEEFEREKQLILEGKLPLESAGKELAEHPVFKISKITCKMIAKRRSTVKVKKLSAPYYPQLEAEAEGEIGWKEAAAVAGEGSMTHVEAAPEEEEAPAEPTLVSMIEEDEAKGYLFPKEVFERLKYESPQVKELRQLETVDELYKLADQIVGPLKNIKVGTCK